MIPVITNPVELRQRGFQCLVDALGWVNAVRFLRQYEAGQGDYTRERDALLPDWDVPTLVQRAEAMGQSERRGGA